MKLYAAREFTLNRTSTRSIKIGLEIKNLMSSPLLYFYGEKGGVVFDFSMWQSLREKQTLLQDFLDGDVPKLDSFKISSGAYATKIFGRKAESSIIGFRQFNTDSLESQCVITGSISMDTLFMLAPIINKYLQDLIESVDEVNSALRNYYEKKLDIPEDKRITKGGVNIPYLFKELDSAAVNEK